MRSRLAKLSYSVAVAVITVMVAGAASATLIFTNTHDYAFGGDPAAVSIEVNLYDDFFGDTSKYHWEYVVTNNSYDPIAGTTNGFSGLETTLPIFVPDLADQYGPAGWDFNCCSGLPIEWDIRLEDGLGVMPGETDIFGFSSAPRFITQSTGWFHTWSPSGPGSSFQTHIVNYGVNNGIEVPDVLRPPLPAIPEPSSALLFGVGSLVVARAVRRRS